MNELVERWTVERAWLQKALYGLETGHVHIGNPWEGRTNARIADLRRKISNLDQLIKTENTHKV
jgi:hypothetical protein